MPGPRSSWLASPIAAESGCLFYGAVCSNGGTKAFPTNELGKVFCWASINKHNFLLEKLTNYWSVFFLLSFCFSCLPQCGCHVTSPAWTIQLKGQVWNIKVIWMILPTKRRNKPQVLFVIFNILFYLSVCISIHCVMLIQNLLKKGRSCEQLGC